VKGDTLDLLGISPAAARIIRYFLIRPEARPHARELQRALELGGASLQRELARMVTLGALAGEKDGSRTRYSVVEGARFWKAVRILAAEATNPGPLLRDALADIHGLDAAFVFGSSASGAGREDSDIDVFIVEGPSVDRRKMLRQLVEVGLILGREVNAVRYTIAALAERLGDPGHPAWGFVREVLSAPKLWVAGQPSNIESLVTAAGIKRGDFMRAAA